MTVLAWGDVSQSNTWLLLSCMWLFIMFRAFDMYHEYRMSRIELEYELMRSIITHRNALIFEPTYPEIGRFVERWTAALGDRLMCALLVRSWLRQQGRRNSNPNRMDLLKLRNEVDMLVLDKPMLAASLRGILDEGMQLAELRQSRARYLLWKFNRICGTIVGYRAGNVQSCNPSPSDIAKDLCAAL